MRVYLKYYITIIKKKNCVQHVEGVLYNGNLGEEELSKTYCSPSQVGIEDLLFKYTSCMLCNIVVQLFCFEIWLHMYHCLLKTVVHLQLYSNNITIYII